MVSLPVYDASGKEVGTYEIDPSAIAPTINKQLLHDVVVMYQANLRRGTAKSKARSEVQGSTKKMYRQKGTGNARAGSRRTNIRRGGGHGHAKRPRDFSYRLPKKAIRLATRMAIASKLISGDVVVLDQLSLQSPKTKQVALILKALGLTGKSTLIATAVHDPVAYLGSRNIDRVTISPVADLNALAILRPQRVLVTKDALDRIKDGSFNQRTDSAA